MRKMREQLCVISCYVFTQARSLKGKIIQKIVARLSIPINKGQTEAIPCFYLLIFNNAQGIPVGVLNAGSSFSPSSTAFFRNTCKIKISNSQTNQETIKSNSPGAVELSQVRVTLAILQHMVSRIWNTSWTHNKTS